MNNQTVENIVIDKKVKGNAVAAYLMIFISGLFVLNKDKPALCNSFVKWHTKTAFFIHTLFLAVIIVFNFYNILGAINIFWFSLNFIVSTSLFIILFITLLYWIYKANKWETFTISDILNFSKTGKLIEIKDSKIKEEWKLTIILAYIPFIWYYLTSKLYNYKSPILKNITKINSLSFLIIILSYIFGHGNIPQLLILIYITFTVFSWIMLIVNNSFIKLNFKFIPTIEELYIKTKSLFKYIWNYFSKNNFITLKELMKNEEELLISKNYDDFNILKEKKDLKFPTISYIPFLNIIYLTKLNTKYKNHIINWFMITIISIIILLIPNINNELLLLLLFPISFWMWYIKRLDYKIPFLHDLFIFLSFWSTAVSKYTKVIKEKHKEENNASFKVWENK